MQHGERCRSREDASRERHSRGVSVHGSYIGTPEPRSNSAFEFPVDLDRCELLHARPQDVGSQARAGSDLERIRAKIDTMKHPRHHLTLENLLPASRSAHPAVDSVHRALQLSIGIEALLFPGIAVHV